MPDKLLFVDDEQALLNGVERLLAFDYDLMLATSGAEALDLIQRHGPFPVVVTDMRMPKMDGIEFVERARAISPQTVFVMLTGNQDQATAIRAVNEGSIFRFLVKPCPSPVLQGGIADALDQHRLLTAEKELLQQTFVGSIRVLTEVVDVACPEAAGRGDATQQRIERLRVALAVDERWEYQLAGRISLVGVALLPAEERARLESACDDPQGIEQILARSAAITGRLVRGIPRLGIVADICGWEAPLTGSLCSLHPKTPGAVAQVGATLLRAATHWDIRARQGLASEEIAKELRAVLPSLPESALQSIVAATEDNASGAGVQVSPSKLVEGMVLASDVTTADGSVLLRRGKRLTGAAIEKLRQQRDLRPISVTEATAHTAKGSLKPAPELEGSIA